MATLPATPDAERWPGWGTALKPAHEPIVVARKPLDGTVAGNVLAHGTGALNVDGCRIATEDTYSYPNGPKGNTGTGAAFDGTGMGRREEPVESNPLGRWPANVVLDEQAAAMLDEQTGECRSAGEYVKGNGAQGEKVDAASIPIDGLTSATYADSGGASRFLYVAKASSAERNAGCEDLAERELLWSSGTQNPGSFQSAGPAPHRNHHPTVKPIDLMRWLVRLVTPPGGIVLDPFTGSGTTGCAAVVEGFRFIGIEREDEYATIAEARIAWWAALPEGIETDKALAANADRQKVEATGQLSMASTGRPCASNGNVPSLLGWVAAPSGCGAAAR